MSMIVSLVIVIKSIDHSAFGLSCTPVASMSVISVVFSGYRCVPYTVDYPLNSFLTIYLNFHPIEAVSRYRDPLEWKLQNSCKSWCLNTRFVSNNSVFIA